MVESAPEFVRICENHDYRELILSMKSSNPVVVLQAYRLLCRRMGEVGMDYPIHLGVTEAGDGEDGRIKSALGIGALLDEGIGDTVRVSLTEDPVHEIPVARALVAPYNSRSQDGPGTASSVVESRDPFSYARRETHDVRVGPHVLGHGNTVLVEVPLGASLTDAKALRAALDAQGGARVPEETRLEIASVDVGSPDDLDTLREFLASVELVAPRVALSARIDAALLLDADEDGVREWFAAAHRLHVRICGPANATSSDRFDRVLSIARDTSRSVLLEVGGQTEDAVALAVRVAASEPTDGSRVLMLGMTPSAGASPLHATRLLAARLAEAGLATPIVLLDHPVRREADPLLGPAAAVGGLLCDGIGDSIQLTAADASDSRRLAFSLLQAARVRTTRTEFISCPSCGRTLFDLEETTARIKSRTSHLKDLKIAVMGCVVNGPGEMADADFGYVGWGENKIALFVGKEMVQKDIPTAEANDRLIELIKEHGRWVDPPVTAVEQA
jgi:(E)-4-hydroxy-3-methylbut-2-enyl-diphosphate synthase